MRDELFWESRSAKLVWSNIDLRRGVITLDENKTDNPRVWSLDKGVVRALQRWKDSRANASATSHVFVDEHGEQLNPDRGSSRSATSRTSRSRASVGGSFPPRPW